VSPVVFAVLALLVQSPSATLNAAAPELANLPNTTLVGYPVGGRNPRAVRTAINAGRPSEGGDRFDGRTTWRYSTRWRTNRAGECDPASAEVTYAITITLPDLVDRARLGSRDLVGWDRYFAALVHHEHNHARIAMRGAEEIQAAMRSANGCETMQGAARQVEAAVAEASRTYDAQTRHGRTEGAVYPRT
jgi:predicted secreted Zn-dependent protease